MKSKIIGHGLLPLWDGNETGYPSDLGRKSSIKAILMMMVFNLVCGSSVIGQEEVEDTFDLSPFTIDGSQYEGYQALSTLAGTRLNTELRDVGSAISVLTEEFFEDTGATNADTVLSFALNAEVSGVNGNFSDSNEGSTAAARRNPQSAQRVRGLSEAQLTRGFFLTDIPFDSFNTTSVTINRGPNTLLFGLGTPGGIIDNAVKQASFFGDSGEIEVRFGERNSHRETFDYNKTIIEGRLGIRIAGLNEKIEYQQRPAFEDDGRIYLALNAVLFKNENSGFFDSTNLRVNFEEGNINGTPPRIIPFEDDLSPWFSVPDQAEIDQIAAIANWTGRGIRTPGYFDSFSPKYTINNTRGNLNQSILFNTVGVAQLPYFIMNPWIYSDPTASTPSVGLADPAIAGVPGRIRWSVGAAQNVPAGQGNSDYFYPVDHLYGNNGVSTLAPGFTAPVIQDRGFYDNTKLLLSGNANTVEHDFDAHNITLDQTFFNGTAGISIAVDKQRYENNSSLPFEGNTITGFTVDINEILANGQPNPNLGRGYIVDRGNSNRFESLTEREALNATAFYKLNFSEGNFKWLGDHTFTAFVGSQEIDNTFKTSQFVHRDIPGNGTNIEAMHNHTVDGVRRGIPIQIYLTEPLFGVNSVSDLNVTEGFTGQLAKPGDVLTHLDNFWDPIWYSDTDRLLKTTYLVDEALIGGGRSRQKIDSEVISLQSSWFGGNLVGLFGLRSDEQESLSRISTTDYQALTGVTNYRFPDGSVDPGSLILNDSGDVEKGDTTTWSLVGHLPKDWVTLAGDSELSVHYNESENFSATGVRRDINGNILPSPSGSTKEYGVTVETLGRKLSIRLNFYETNNAGATVSGPGFGFPGVISDGMSRYKNDEKGLIASGLTPEEALRTTLERSVIFRPEILNIDDLLAAFPTWDSVYEAHLALLPETQRNRFLGFNTAGIPVWTANPGQSVTQSFVSEGVELEMVGRLTNNWTISFNVAEQETVTSDTAPVGRVFVQTIMDNINKTTYLKDMIWAPIQNERRSIQETFTNGPFNAMNALIAKDGQVSQEQRRYRANLVTNYQFSEGGMNGFGLGGALRWQDKIATGYEVVTDDASVVTPRLDRPFFGPEELNGDIWLSYNRPIMKERFDWKIQLNVRNLIGDKDYIPVVTNPDGRVAVVRNPNPQEIFLTNTFRF